ncbi:MAG: hypothetical protein GXO66_06995 [Euryarchaeota archaeon]|nr:hypothetical protein [Euryarchaeota archaeon]
MIRDYIRELEQKLRELEHLIEKREIEIEIITEELAVVKGELHFLDGSVLDFMELLSPNEYNYRFHWMDGENRLICRWDSAPHHRVKSFPYQKHTTRGVENSRQMRLLDVLEEVEEEIIKKVDL